MRLQAQPYFDYPNIINGKYDYKRTSPQDELRNARTELETIKATPEEDIEDTFGYDEAKAVLIEKIKHDILFLKRKAEEEAEDFDCESDSFEAYQMAVHERLHEYS